MTRAHLAAILLVTIFAALLVGCSTARLSEFATSTGVDGQTKRPTGVTQTFQTTTPEIFVTAKLSNAPPNTVVRFDWYYVAKGETFIAPVEIKTDGTRYLSASLTRPDRGWPVGNYEVRVFLDGKEVTRVPFSIR